MKKKFQNFLDKYLIDALEKAERRIKRERKNKEKQKQTNTAIEYNE